MTDYEKSNTETVYGTVRGIAGTIAKFRMIGPGESILAAVSGGPDSVALIHVLVELGPEFSVNRLGVAHLNHCLRGEVSDSDERFVSSLAENLGLPFFTDRKNVEEYRRLNKLSVEEAARHLRYEFLFDTASKNGFDKIAVGHHANDNAELVLMNMIRGSGPRGLSGIPPVRGGKIIRPLVKTGRIQIARYIESKGLPYVTDASNRDEAFLRNRVRHSLLPELATYNPKIGLALNRLSAIVRSEDEWMREMSVRLFNKCLVGNKTGESVSLSIPILGEMHTAARKRVIRLAIENIKGGLRRISSAHIEAAEYLALDGSNNGCLDLPDHIGVLKQEDRLSFVKKARFSNSPVRFEYDVLAPGTVFIKEVGMRLVFSVTNAKHVEIKAGTEYFDADSLGFPLKIRNFRHGDRFRPLGMKGSQKLKNFFINNKIPPAERSMCPVLVCKGEIVCVVGHRIADGFKLRPETANALKMEVLLA